MRWWRVVTVLGVLVLGVALSAWTFAPGLARTPASPHARLLRQLQQLLANRPPLAGRQPPAARRPLPRFLPVPPPGGWACFVGPGSCSSTPCIVPVARPGLVAASAETIARPVAAVVRAPSAVTATCHAPPHVLGVSGP